MRWLGVFVSLPELSFQRAILFCGEIGILLPLLGVT
jgi:hypothetical protein